MKSCQSSLQSPFAAHIEAFISQKRAIGYHYKAEEYQLLRFDAFCTKQNITEPTLTKELTEQWIQKRDGEAVKNQSLRCSVVRQFAQFLSSYGLAAYVLPAQKNTIPQNYTPYIFSSEELKAIFNVADQMSPCTVSPFIHEVMPMILRLLYGCGLRSGEACHLKKCDILLDDGVLTVLNAKNEKDRLVPMSASLVDRCRAYSERMELLCPDTVYLFPNKYGSCVEPSTVYSWFRRFLFKARIPHRGRGKGPRVHDLRHTFAVHSLQKMARDGMDLYCALPILSMYLGHENISATEKYLRMTAAVHPEILEQLQCFYGSMLPAEELEAEQ